MSRTPITPQQLTRLQVVFAVIVLSGTVAVWFYAPRVSGQFTYITPDPAAVWITSARPAGLQPVRVLRDQPITARFVRSFRVGDPQATVRVRLRAVRELALYLNDEVVPLPDRDPEHWKRETVVDLTGRLLAGENQLAAVVRSLEGPPLLWLATEGLPRDVATGSSWQLVKGERRSPARIAIDVHRHPLTPDLPSTLDGLGSRAVPIGLGFLLAALPVWLLPAGARSRLSRFAVPLTVGAVALFWIALFAEKAVQFPKHLGYDVQGHDA